MRERNQEKRAARRQRLKEKKYNYRKKLPGQLRLLLAALFVLAQIGLILYLYYHMRSRAIVLYILFQVLGVFMAIFVVRHQRSAAYATPWVILLLLAPPVGVSLYLLWGRQSLFNESRRLLKEYLSGQREGPSAEDSLSQLPGLSRLPNFTAPRVPIASQRVSPAVQLHEFDSEQALPEAYYHLPLPARFLTNWGFALYQGTELQYFSTGAKQFEAMFSELRQAQKFIFAEYYIVNEGKIWDEFCAIICERRAEGVEVKLLIDDFACAGRISRLMLEPLVQAGVEIRRFNPILRSTSRMYINYRNHQKLCLIDGDIAYYSGTNLADEYANIYQPFGYWKDNALRLHGAAAWEGLKQFFMMWRLAEGEVPEQLSRYLPSPTFPLCLTPWDVLVQDGVVAPDGRLSRRGHQFLREAYGRHYEDSAEARRIRDPQSFIIPFWDGPVNNPHNIGEELYLSMISSANEHIFINTPYLVVDETFSSALARAAASGIDVRIMTPGIPDKKTVYATTRANYEKLLRAGVRIFEFSPGFNHDKTLIVDQKMAVSGSLNFDFRSFNLNYENGVFIYNDEVISEMSSDFLNAQEQSREIDLQTWLERPLSQRFIQELLRIFAPLV